MLLFVCLFGIINTIVQGTSQGPVYKRLNEAKLVGQQAVLDGQYSRIQCSAHCEGKQSVCLAVNHNKDVGSCEILQSSGGGKPYPVSSSGWETYYKRFSDISYKNGATAVQSSIGWEGLASYAVDDLYLLYMSITGQCSHTSWTTPNWLLVDFNFMYTIEGLKIWNRAEVQYTRLRDLVITISSSMADINDVDNRCAVYTGPPASINDNPVMLTCYQPMAGRFLKILMTTSFDTALTICELDLM